MRVSFLAKLYALRMVLSPGVMFVCLFWAIMFGVLVGMAIR